MIFFFDDCSLDTERRELRRDGVECLLEPQVFDLLEHLIRNRDRVVSRNEILEAIWHGRIVSDAALDTRLSAARKAIGDTGAAQRCIRTLRARGVHFIAAVREESGQTPVRCGGISSGIGIPAVAPPPEAERRHLTVLSCDFIGVQALATRIDPEQLRNVIGACHECCSQAAARWEGSVARFADHGATIHFSYPQAHEDDAERAVRAGLDLIERIATSQTSRNHSLSARVGIATGLVVVGNGHDVGIARDAAVFGEAPTLAAALRSVAAPDNVLIAEGTHHLLGALFEYQPVGPLSLGGFPRPVTAWRVCSVNQVESRFEARRKARLTPFFGREQELKLLLRKWAEAKTGSGRVVLISGEPGIGKSRIIAQLGERLMSERYARVLCQCSPYHSDTALHPFIAQLKRYAAISPRDTPERRYEKLEAVVAIRGPNRQTAVPLLAGLLSIPDIGRYAPLTSSPQQQRRQTFQALLDQLEALARRQPLLLAFEDAHWADATSIELLDLMSERIRRLPVLVLITFRPEFEPPWTGLPSVATFSLGRLAQQDARAMVERLAGDRAISAEIVDQIVAKADGIPLFIEELTCTILDSILQTSNDPAHQLPLAPTIPSTLQDSLAARLDRLGLAKEIAQIGAAIGRHFTYALLRAVAPMEENALREALARLEGSGLVLCRGRPPEATYTFKHVLVQDAAYNTLLREARRTLHTRIGETLETQFTEIAESQPEILAYHYAQAGLIEKAVGLWHKAGQQSLARSALVEAAEQFKRALAQIDTLRVTATLHRERINLQVALINPLVHLKGYAAAETKSAAERARLLIEEADALGESPEDPLLLFSVRYSLWVANYVAFNGDVVRELATQFLALAERRKLRIPLVIGHRLMGRALLSTGEIAQGLVHFERALTLYDNDSTAHRAFAMRFGQDVQVSIFSYRSIAMWMLGHYDAATADAEKSLKDARGIGHAATLMYALYHTSFTHIHCGNHAAGMAEAEELVALAHEKGSVYWKARGMINRGCVLALAGKGSEAVQILRSAIDAYRSTGASLFTPWYLSALAQSYAELAQFDDARRCIGEAIATIKTSEERWYEAEVNRIAGEILLKSSGQHAVKADTYFKNALEIARQQRAKSFELRAAISRARLWRDQGDREQALDLLTAIYGWFTEGLETTDLKEARALIEALRS